METMPFHSQPAPASLVVLEAGQAREYSLTSKYVWDLGRQTPDSKPDISLTSHLASRKHGKITCLKDQWFYQDLGSLNGTYHNGEKVAAKQAVFLQNGDVLRIDTANLAHPDRRGVWILFTTDALGQKWQPFHFTRKVTVFGRDPSQCDFVLERPYVSAKHMTITQEGSDYYIADCGSTAGTKVNGRYLHGKRKLQEKDFITLCDCKLVFTAGQLLYNLPKIKSPASQVADEHAQYLAGRQKLLCVNIKSKSAGPKQLLKDVRFDIEEGALVAILGTSGAGKTTLLTAINGMNVAGVDGSITYQGEELLNSRAGADLIRQKFGYVPQQNIGEDRQVLTVEYYLSFSVKAKLPHRSHKEYQQRVNQTLQMLDLTACRKKQIRQCSGGEQRRVMIGTELVADKEVLFLDEPDAGLDPGMKDSLFKNLQRLAHDHGKTILAIVHDVEKIDCFDKVVFLQKRGGVGRLAYLGTPEAVADEAGVGLENFSRIYQNLEQEK